MTTHRAASGTPASWPAARLLTTGTVGGRHRGFLRPLVRMARGGEWHAFWCRLGDAVDETTDIVIAWATVVLAGIAVVAAGAVIGFAGGPVVAGAYVAAVAVAVALWVRAGRRSS